MEDYIKNFKNYEKTIVYDFKLGDGGIGDYLKFFMIILTECMNSSSKVKLYHKINDLEIEKYIKLKYDFMNIDSDKISKLTNVSIKTPKDYYYKDSYNGTICLNEVFYFDDVVKMNVKNILPSLVSDYISIHLRIGDKFLETNKKFVLAKKDKRRFSEQGLYKLTEENTHKNIIFFCDNNQYKLKINKKYRNIIISNAQIGHTSLSNTTNKQVLDTISEFYVLTQSKIIYGVSKRNLPPKRKNRCVFSGFSNIASKFNNVDFVNI